MSSRLTEKQLDKAEAALAEAGSIRGAARLLGIQPKDMRRRRNRLAELGRLSFEPVMPGFRVHSVVNGPKGTSVRQVRDAGDKFEVPEGFALSRISAHVDADGRMVGGWRIATPDKAVQVELFKAALDEMKREIPRVEPTPAPENTSALLCNAFTVTDHHFGMMAWHEETRGDSYDLDIAERIWTDWFAAAIEMSPNAESAVLAQLGD